LRARARATIHPRALSLSRGRALSHTLSPKPAHILSLPPPHARALSPTLSPKPAHLLSLSPSYPPLLSICPPPTPPPARVLFCLQGLVLLHGAPRTRYLSPSLPSSLNSPPPDLCLTSWCVPCAWLLLPCVYPRYSPACCWLLSSVLILALVFSWKRRTVGKQRGKQAALRIRWRGHGRRGRNLEPSVLGRGGRGEGVGVELTIASNDCVIGAT